MASINNDYKLDRVIMDFSPMGQYRNYWTLDDATKGVQIFGGTGSGKTSGSGKTFARAYLDSGFGGLVLCAKNDEKEQWVRWAERTGRTDDIIVFSPDNDYRFNFLSYEMERTSKGGGLTFNLVDIFMQLNEIAQGKKGKGGGADSFWDDALRELLTNSIDLVKYAKTELSIDTLHDIIQSIARNTEDLYSETEELTEFEKESYCYQLISYVLELYEDNDLTDSQWNDVRKAQEYFYKTYPQMDERVQSTILQSFTGIANQLGRGVLRELFSTTTNITPDDTINGKIIILDMSIHSYGAAGKYGQILFKYMWQKAVERRPKGHKAVMRPVFLWVDESQLFLTEYDMIFQTTARSSRVCTVYLSQNISNYYAVMPGGNAKYRTDSLLGNLNTKVFHANDDFATNKWASIAIGTTLVKMGTGGTSLGDKDKSSFSSGFSTQFKAVLEPHEFRFLKTGGSMNTYQVEGIVLVTGKKFKTNYYNPYMRAFFSQLAN